MCSCTLLLLYHYLLLLQLLPSAAADPPGHPINCNQTTKQKSLYAGFTHDPPLASTPAFDMETEVQWVDTTSRAVNSNGIYDAFMTYFQPACNRAHSLFDRALLMSHEQIS